MSKFNVGDIVFYKTRHRVAYCLITHMKFHNSCGVKCVRLDRLINQYKYNWFPECLDKLDKYCEKQSVRKIQCSERDFKLLKQMHGIGCFYHDLSPVYEKLCIKPPKFVIFRNVSTKQQLILHLGKATKVLKRIGFEHNGNYERVRVVKPMIRLQFIGEL